MANLRGGTRDVPEGPNSFNSMQFLGKFGKIVCWRPPPQGNPGSATVEFSLIANNNLSITVIQYLLIASKDLLYLMYLLQSPEVASVSINYYLHSMI